MTNTECTNNLQTLLQGYFNQAMTGWMNQKWQQSVDSVTGQCRYRNDTGLKCLVGMLIPDESYNHGLEGNFRYYNFAHVIPGLRELHKFSEINKVESFMCELQTIHDDPSMDGINFTRKRIIMFADHWNLTIPQEVMKALDAACAANCV